MLYLLSNDEEDGLLPPDEEEDKKDQHKTTWEIFQSGRWSKNPPTKPGYYPIADREGVLKGVCEVSKKGYTDKLYGHIIGGAACSIKEVWRGYWWTKPLPNFPTCKDWDEND